VASGVKLSGPSMVERIANRLKNSGQGMGTNPDQTASHGTGPTRTHTNLHHSAAQTGAPMSKAERNERENYKSGR
jgi:hypothetical protein